MPRAPGRSVPTAREPRMSVSFIVGRTITMFRSVDEPPSIWSPRLLDYAHLPPWRHDNAYILSSYRPQTFSHSASLPSLFYLHNESCNIWSHLVGLFFFAAFGTYFVSHLGDIYPNHSEGDWFAFLAFFVGVSICLAASASFHLFSAIGPVEARKWNGVDYAGIVACIWGSFVAALHFGFDEQHAGARRRYEGMITVLGAACVGVSVMGRFRTPGWRKWRAGMFVALGLSAVVPVGHGVGLYGLEGLERRMALSWVVRQGVLYVVGAGLYAARIPERWAPGRFDVWGSSHQIFHVLVVAAALAHLKGLLQAMNYRHSLV
ncbi:hemolysin-III related-domain-containing protein [Elsinoe ampelina]|uniref:Hemolysin-III related-domain-containing protein n=1 Tax=Elsinoe ampelina TaxID=302913 RepID=A0A6A6GKW9_9PEZI|nr:hemolysin-III related-domain-containing protein [Elsinoe ampelina]